MDEYGNIGEKLGSGSWGVVYSLGDKYALKKITSGTNTNFETTTEIDILFRLNCPFILKGVKIIDPRTNPQVKNGGYIIDRADETFADIVDKRLTIDRKEYTTLCYQICLAIQFLHQNNYLHLDVTSTNCMYIKKEHYTAQLIDFGLTAAVQRNSHNEIIPYKSKQPRITTIYRPPECFNYTFEDKQTIYTYTDKADVWSLGIVFIELFYSNSPFNIQETGAPREYIEKINHAIGENKRRLEKGLHDICVKDQIPRLFGDLNKSDTLNRLLSCQTFDKLMWIDLLSKMLEINSIKRITIDDVIKHPVFESARKITQQRNLQDSYVLFYPLVEPIYMSEGRKKIVESILSIFSNISKFHVETYFTALDITLRLFASFDESVSDDWLRIYMLTCVSIALRLYEFQNMIPIDLQRYSNVNIYEREIKVFKVLKGIFRQPLIYMYCDSLEQLICIYKMFFSSADQLGKYTSVDIKDVCKSIECNGKLSKNVNIETFINYLTRSE